MNDDGVYYDTVRVKVVCVYHSTYCTTPIGGLMMIIRVAMAFKPEVSHKMRPPANVRKA